MLRRMFPKLKLTGFLESSHGEQGLVLQIHRKEMRPLETDMGLVVDDVFFYSSLQRIPYDSLSGLPPSELDISRSFSVATQCSLYLAPKLASLVSDVASSFAGIPPPSLFIFAELRTLNTYVPPELLISRRQDPFLQPRENPLRSRLFYDDYLISDSVEARETAVRYSSERNRSSAGRVSAAAISKLKRAKLVRKEREVGDCSVCLEEMSAVEELLTMPCDHTFHEQCLLSWLEKKNSCPLCRSQLQE